jgi:transcriptional antiterminator RfaH
MMSSNPTLRWYVVQTHSHAEIKASWHLQRQGFETYLPRYLKRRRHARRTETVIVPLFPRYLFVAVDMTSQRWLSIRSTIGVTRLVCDGDRPAAVPEAVFEAIKRREDANGLIQLDRKPQFSPGDKVCIRDGAFQECLGLYEGMTSNERVTILLEFVGRKVRVSLDTEMLIAV